MEKKDKIKVCKSIDIESHSVEDTTRFGIELSTCLKGGEVVLLSGPLGCGKTVFTKGIARGLNIEDTITSPSFAIMLEYQGDLNLYHFDFYRIDDSNEMEELLQDYIYKNDGVVVIEWGEKVSDVLNTYILVTFNFDNDLRVIKIEWRGY